MLSIKCYIDIEHKIEVTNTACQKMIHAIEKIEQGNEKSEI